MKSCISPEMNSGSKIQVNDLKYLKCWFNANKKIVRTDNIMTFLLYSNMNRPLKLKKNKTASSGGG